MRNDWTEKKEKGLSFMYRSARFLSFFVAQPLKVYDTTAKTVERYCPLLLFSNQGAKKKVRVLATIFFYRKKHASWL